jgi:hypothetical protein
MNPEQTRIDQSPWKKWGRYVTDLTENFKSHYHG